MCANGATRTGRRFSSSTACRRTISADEAVRKLTGRGVPARRLRSAWHDMSEAPLETEHYTDPELWAADMAAIIDQLGLDRPVLVGWSYGPPVICDYLRVHGVESVAGIEFVGGAVKLAPSAFGTLLGPGFLDHFADLTMDDLPSNFR